MLKIIKDSQENLDRLAANFIVDSLKVAYEKRGFAVLAVPGGRSVAGIFMQLTRSSVDWSRVHLFLVDERLVPLESSESNFGLVKEQFIDLLKSTNCLLDKNLHPFIYQSGVVDLGLGEYEKELVAFGGRFDVILLSAGEDGHVGALYPHHPSIENPADFFISMNDSPKPPAERMSSSLRLLKRSGLAILLFYGQGKRDALANFNNNQLEVLACPAKLVNDLPQAYILTDLN